MSVKFYYENNNHSYKKEILITEMCRVISSFLELPDTIEVCLFHLGGSTYGGIDIAHPNRMCIDYDIPHEKLPIIVVHELIHLNQRKTNKLRITHDGRYYWNDVYFTNKLPDNMTREEYIALPWEADVVNRQKQVMHEFLEKFHNPQT